MAEVGINGFFGEFDHSLDAKNRLTIPAKWRPMEGADARLLIIPNPSLRCLNVYTPDKIEQIKARMADVSMANDKSQRVIKSLFSRADLVTCDAQGRLNISEKLAEHATLTKEVKLLGNLSYFEIWNPEHYTRYMSEDSISDADLASILPQLGL